MNSKNKRANYIINHSSTFCGGTYVDKEDNKQISFFTARYNNNTYYIEYKDSKCITLKKIK